MSVPTIHLMDYQLDDLSVVSEISLDSLENLKRELGSTRGTINPSTIVKIIVSKIGPERAPAFRRALFGLEALCRRTDTFSIQDLLSGVRMSLASKWSEEKVRSWDSRSDLLAGFLSLEMFSLAIKARDLSFDFERYYLASRILTDIRPVFDDARSQIKAAMVIHTLRIEFIAPNDEQCDLSMALDLDAIKQLRKICDEAIRKEEIALKILPENIEKIMPTEEEP